MGTKISPSVYDCHGDALPDEPLFTLLARDPQAPKLVRQWARDRAEAVALGQAPKLDAAKVSEAYELAQKMEVWRAKRRNDNVAPVLGEHQYDFENISCTVTMPTTSDKDQPRFLCTGHVFGDPQVTQVPQVPQVGPVTERTRGGSPGFENPAGWHLCAHRRLHIHSSNHEDKS